MLIRKKEKGREGRFCFDANTRRHRTRGGKTRRETYEGERKKAGKVYSPLGRFGMLPQKG